MRYRSSCAIALSVVLVAIFICLFTVGTRADNDVPTLYCNDEVWYKTDIYPLMNHNSIYVPISIFEQFPGISITMYEKNNTALIHRSEEQYISFDFNRDAAMSPLNSRFYLKTYIENGERYVPLVTTCVSLGLQHETYTSTVDGSVSARICDGSQTKTFPELLQRYHPGALAPVTTETTQPPQTDPVPIDPLKNAVFITISGLDGTTLLPAMLELMEEKQVYATFFVTPQELRAYPDAVISILAGGHMLGLLVEAADIAAQLADANAYLAEHYFTSTRLVRIAAERTEQSVDAWLAAEGYSRLGTHFDLGLTETSVRSALLNFRQRLADEGQIVITVWLDGYHPVSYLREFIESAADRRAFLPITPAYSAIVQ